MNRYPPGPTGLESIATVFRFQRDPLNTLTGLVERYGDVVCYRFGPFPVVLLNCPEVVNLALVDHHPNYGKEKNPFYRMLRSFLGEGLLTSDGPFWLRQRRLAQPAFARKGRIAISTMRLVGGRSSPSLLTYCIATRTTGLIRRGLILSGFSNRSLGALSSPSRPGPGSASATTSPCWKRARS